MDMVQGAENYTLLGLVLALSLGLVEIIKQMAYRKWPKKLPDPNGYGQLIKDLTELVKHMTDEIKEVNSYHHGCKAKMERLVEMHQSFDEQGRPKWWFPPGIEKHTAETAQALERVAIILARHDEFTSKSIEKFAETLEKQSRILETMEKNMEKCANKIASFK